jgi:hypothetical protein
MHQRQAEMSPARVEAAGNTRNAAANNLMTESLGL